MADLSDVETAIVGDILGALYPNGISQPSAVSVTCRVYRGWPSPAGLNSDLTAGAVNVTVFPSSVPDELPDPYFDRQYVTPGPNSLIGTVNEQSVTFSGSAAEGQIVGLLVDGRPFTYVTQQGDTTVSIAANMAALIASTRIVGVSGAAVTVPNAITLTVRVVMNASVLMALRRQRREIQVNCWCPSPALRDAVCSVIDIALSESGFIDLSDGTKAHVHYISTEVFDQSLNALLYRRDLRYKLEYTTVISSVAPVMLFGDFVSNGHSTLV